MSSTESVSPYDVIVCACGTHEYTAGDAVDAAVFRGELEEKWQAFLRHLAAEERADELELELDESAISAAAEEFRYRHDLITAEETERWLSNRGPLPPANRPVALVRCPSDARISVFRRRSRLV